MRSAARSTPDSRCRHSSPPSVPGKLPRDACPTPTVARSTRPRSIASSLPTMASSARWAGGNPYEKPKAESFMKTLKVETVYLMAYKTFEDVTAELPASSTTSTTPRRLRSALGLPEPHPVRGPPRPADGQTSGLILSGPRGSSTSSFASLFYPDALGFATDATVGRRALTLLIPRYMHSTMSATFKSRTSFASYRTFLGPLPPAATVANPAQRSISPM
jgi:hypothetical protein